jgi:hypothetical protein
MASGVHLSKGALPYRDNENCCRYRNRFQFLIGKGANIRIVEGESIE